MCDEERRQRECPGRELCDTTRFQGTSMTPMLNYIWFGLMAIALVVAAFNGTADGVTKGAVESAGTAVQIALGLIGIMALWLGVMRIAEAAGLLAPPRPGLPAGGGGVFPPAAPGPP